MVWRPAGTPAADWSGGAALRSRRPSTSHRVPASAAAAPAGRGPRRLVSNPCSRSTSMATPLAVADDAQPPVPEYVARLRARIVRDQLKGLEHEPTIDYWLDRRDRPVTEEW